MLLFSDDDMKSDVCGKNADGDVVLLERGASPVGANAPTWTDNAVAERRQNRSERCMTCCFYLL